MNRRNPLEVIYQKNLLRIKESGVDPHVLNIIKSLPPGQYSVKQLGLTGKQLFELDKSMLNKVGDKIFRLFAASTMSKGKNVVKYTEDGRNLIYGMLEIFE